MTQDRRTAEQALSKSREPKVYLDMFWAAVDGATKAKRLDLLRAMGAIKPERGWEKPEKRRREMRKHFTFALIDFPAEAPCFVCGGPWHHRHHVLNIQHGGGNSRRNIVPLCKPCHHAVHGRTF